MALAVVYSRASSGIDAPLVTVEVHLSNGLPKFNMVGLPESSVKESRDRVRSALLNTQFEFPMRKITVNLAPADLPKEGGRFDLPIALGILAASGQIPAPILKEYEFAGELALSGELRPIRGVLPIALGAYLSGRQLIVPHTNAREAALVRQGNILSASHLLEVCAHLCGKKSLPVCLSNEEISLERMTADLSDVKGQASVKRALEIAAAGHHSLLLIGPPGTGKTMLASRLPSILPNMNEEDALEVAAIASVSSAGFDPTRFRETPFRSPHHSSSSAALVGGGRPPRPGEISLAHHGVLFLDELPEFNRHVLECLREPLESGCITISRAAFQAIFPAKFQFVAAMNPCPCGYAGSTQDDCRCSPDQIKRYLAKLSGPLLDRIDMQVEVAKIPLEELVKVKEQGAETSKIVRERVIKARHTQKMRQAKWNSHLSVPELDQYGELKAKAQSLLTQIVNKFNLSARVYHRIIKVARTIADLEESLIIKEVHVSEALSFRCLDRSKLLIFK